MVSLSKVYVLEEVLLGCGVSANLFWNPVSRCSRLRIQQQHIFVLSRQCGQHELMPPCFNLRVLELCTCCSCRRISKNVFLHRVTLQPFVHLAPNYSCSIICHSVAICVLGKVVRLRSSGKFKACIASHSVALLGSAFLKQKQATRSNAKQCKINKAKQCRHQCT